MEAPIIMHPSQLYDLKIAERASLAQEMIKRGEVGILSARAQARYPMEHSMTYRAAAFMCKNAEAVAELFKTAGWTQDGEACPPDVYDNFKAELRLAHFLKTGK